MYPYVLSSKPSFSVIAVSQVISTKEAKHPNRRQFQVITWKDLWAINKHVSCLANQAQNSPIQGVVSISHCQLKRIITLPSLYLCLVWFLWTSLLLRLQGHIGWAIHHFLSDKLYVYWKIASQVIGWWRTPRWGCLLAGSRNGCGM